VPEYLHPGVFVEEIGTGAKPIAGVPTSTAAFLGVTERGPMQPCLVTGLGEFARLFGGAGGDDAHLPHAVEAFFANGGTRAFVCRVAGEGSRAAGVTLGKVVVTALGPGEAYHRVIARIGAASAPTGWRLSLFCWDEDPGGYWDPFDPDAAAANRDKPQPSIVEDYDGLSLDPSSLAWWERCVNQGGSALATIAVAADATLADFAGPAIWAQLLGGADGSRPGVDDFKGRDGPEDADRTGLAALELCEDVAVVAAPGQTEDGDAATLQAIVAHCEQMRYRIAVLDGPASPPDPGALDPRTAIGDSSYAAYYYPWYWIEGQGAADRVAVPPSGAVCGIFARTDDRDGVWKAPANAEIVGALDVLEPIDTTMQEVLDPRGVNVIRSFTGSGIRLWGARTLSDDPEWKYVSVRRLMLFLEASIDQGTRWVVFESNNELLWARVTDVIGLFLRGLWRAGAFAGVTEEEAFWVSAGYDTMTQDDELNGRLIVEIGVAPVRPAEFVVFRLGQWTADAHN
jgi:phage tail sheath protein FI